ncbi:hypothetical protein N7478_001884 [Penicillium angulare]|uniref:uncharacterized protein n=1 Tax=Penicillium angulare TaxID=116970 RepID=UPI00253F7C4B|nr:uncharacterized protein N7478_001884 [Penicillium angulare]KAJ5288854.1 hypothetical protein N7478_001884 [Penicillium angulare]
MASPLKNIAIIGASGRIGAIILEGLLKASQFNITAILRKESTAVFPPKFNVIKSDLSENDLVSAFQGQDAVISAIGGMGVADQKKIVHAALRAGIKRFIPSEFSVDSLNDAVLQLLPVFQVKRDLIEYLKTKQSDGLTWTGIATSGLLDWCLRNSALDFDIPSRTATIWDGGNKSFTLTNEKELQESVVAVLQHPEETCNKSLHVASVETTQIEILSALEEATGSKWKVIEPTTDAQVEEGAKRLSAGDFGGALIALRATIFGNKPGLKGNYAKDTRLANDVLGLKLDSVQATVQRVVSD